MPGRTERYLPPSRWARDYRPAWLKPDLVAGATTAAVVVPQAMAYATLAGLPVQYGLYVAFVPMLAYAALGTSRALSVSSTSTISILTATAVAGVAATDAEVVTAATTLAVITGCLLLAAGLLRLGSLADYISLPILTGFKVGTGLVIVASQLGKLTGIPVEGGNFFTKVWSALTQIGDVQGPTLGLAAASIGFLLLLRQVSPRLPGALLVVALGVIAVAVLDLTDHGVEVVPPVPAGLPGFSTPDAGLVQDLLPAATGIALMCFVESIAAARAFEHKSDGDLDPDQELRALGGANLLGGLFHGFPAGGGLSQTAVNDGNGARSQLAGGMTAVGVVLTMLFLTGLLENLADATLGAVVLVAVLGLLDTSAIRGIARVRRRDAYLALVTVAGVLLLGVLNGVLMAVVVSILSLMYSLNRMPIRRLGRNRATGTFEDVDRDPLASTLPGLLILKPEGGFYFANARRVADRALSMVDNAQPSARVLVVDVSAVPDLEVTAAFVLDEFDESLAERGVELWLCELTARPLDMLRRTGDAERFDGRLFRSLAEAVARFESVGGRQ